MDILNFNPRKLTLRNDAYQPQRRIASKYYFVSYKDLGKDRYDSANEFAFYTG